MSKDFWKKEREELYKRVVENIKFIADVNLYKDDELIAIGAGFTDSDYLLTDMEDYISIFENNKEVLKIDKNSNILVMLSEILKED